MNYSTLTRFLFGSFLAMSCIPADAQRSLAETYKPQAEKLIAAGLADTEGYANLTYLCDHIGKRISGSEPFGARRRLERRPDAQGGARQRHHAESHGPPLGSREGVRLDHRTRN